MTSRNVPRLRFKGFENEWGNSILSNLSSIFDGVHKTPNYVQHGIPFYSVENLKTMKTDKYISDEEYKDNFKKNIPEYGDILMSRIGSIGEVNLVDSNKSLAFYVTLALLKPNNEEVASLFLNSAMQSPSIQKELWRRTLHVAFPKKINKNEIGNVVVNYPSLPEQQHIGNFFSKLDHLIDLHSQKLEQLKKLKRGYLQKMFPQKDEKVPRIRFSEFHDDWKNVKVSSICNREDNKRVAVKEAQRKHGSVPYYGANGIQDYVDNFTHDGNYVLIAEDGAKSIINYPIYYVSGKIWVNNHAHVLSAKDGKSDIKFLASLFSNFNFYRYLVGGGRYKLNADILMNLEVKCPSISEQQKISKFLNEIDCLIEKSSDKVSELKRQKKAYLQKMFI